MVVLGRLGLTINRFNGQAQLAGEWRTPSWAGNHVSSESGWKACGKISTAADKMKWSPGSHQLWSTEGFIPHLFHDLGGCRYLPFGNFTSSGSNLWTWRSADGRWSPCCITHGLRARCVVERAAMCATCSSSLTVTVLLTSKYILEGQLSVWSLS